MQDWNSRHVACIRVKVTRLAWVIEKRGIPRTGGKQLSESPTEGGDNVEDSLKQLMHDLGNAINDSLSESDRIAEAIGEIRRNGYDVFLVLEATIGFNRRDDADDEATQNVTVSEAKPSRITTAKLKFTPQDERFLKALKITADE